MTSPFPMDPKFVETIYKARDIREVVAISMVGLHLHQRGKNNNNTTDIVALEMTVVIVVDVGKSGVGVRATGRGPDSAWPVDFADQDEEVTEVGED